MSSREIATTPLIWGLCDEITKVSNVFLWNDDLGVNRDDENHEMRKAVTAMKATRVNTSLNVI